MRLAKADFALAAHGGALLASPEFKNCCWKDCFLDVMKVVGSCHKKEWEVKILVTGNGFGDFIHAFSPVYRLCGIPNKPVFHL
jgi:hypothetical protein